MKIAHISDIHNDLETFDRALKEVSRSDAELLAITGDLAGEVFDKKEIEEFRQVAEVIANIFPQTYHLTNGGVNSLRGCASFICSKNVQVEEQLKKISRRYLELEELAGSRIMGQYEQFKQRFSGLKQRVVLVPGNWSHKNIDDVLAEHNLHLKHPEEIGNISFVGYGGAREIPVKLPQDLVIEFNEDEAFLHLCKYSENKNKGLVSLMHVPPRGFSVREGTHRGEFCMLAYMYKAQPDIILAGHTHKLYIGQDNITGTFILNPGNLGKYEDMDFGSFLYFDIDNNFFVKDIMACKIDGSGIRAEKISL